MKCIVFTGGGTGGHIYPGLAVIDEFRLINDSPIAWIGNSRGMDRSIVEAHGLRFYGIPSGKLRRYASFRNFLDLFLVFAGFVSSFFLLLRLRPALVFSKGGFVSVPPCFAAKLLRIPVITHECDFSPGLATRLNARSAKRVFVSYEDTRQAFPEPMRAKVTVTGNPVRSAFYHASAERGRAFLGCADASIPIVFAQGGSLGARQINDLIAQSLDRLCPSCFVVHQTGAQNADQAAKPSDPALGARYKSYPFIKAEMPDVVAAADIVVARAGANTVWECAAAGKPMVLVPLEKGSSRGDQVENARFCVAHGAAVMLSGEDATPDRLVETVTSLLADRDRYRAMCAAAAALGAQRPAALVARLLDEELVSSHGVAR